MSLLFNMLSKLVIALLPRSKCLLILWLQSPSAVILEPPKISHCFHCFPIYLPRRDGTRCHVFWMLSFKPTFSLSSFTFIKRFFVFSSLSAISVVSSAYLRLLIFLPEILIPACASFSLMFSWCTLHISSISRVTIYSCDILLSRFGTCLLFHVQF